MIKDNPNAATQAEDVQPVDEQLPQKDAAAAAQEQESQAALLIQLYFVSSRHSDSETSWEVSESA